MASGAKPAHLNMVGGKSGRQRMWETLRTLAKSNVALTTYNVSRRSGQDDEAVREYLRALAKAGIVRQIEVMDRDGLWELVKDEGAEAPRVNRHGKRLPAEAVECIWRALRILGELDAAEAANQAAIGGAAISENGARIYLQGLSLAGYVTRSGGIPGVPATYRLVPGRYSGPLHPIYQRSTYEQVYDPNLDKVVWEKNVPADPAELCGLRLDKANLEKQIADLRAVIAPVRELAGRSVAQFHPADRERQDGIDALARLNKLLQGLSV